MRHLVGILLSLSCLVIPGPSSADPASAHKPDGHRRALITRAQLAALAAETKAVKAEKSAARARSKADKAIAYLHCVEDQDVSLDDGSVVENCTGAE